MVQASITVADVKARNYKEECFALQLHCKFFSVSKVIWSVGVEEGLEAGGHSLSSITGLVQFFPVLSGLGCSCRAFISPSLCSETIEI